MKIAFINDIIYAYAAGSPSAVGGAERFQWLLARALARAGSEVVVGVRGALAPRDRRVIDGVEFSGIGAGHVLSAWHGFFREHRPDWWYWQAASHLWGAAVEFARLARVRTIFSAALDRDFEPRRALSLGRRWWPLYAWGLSRTDKIFAQHHGQLAALPAHWRSKASILPGIVGRRPAVKPHAERENYIAWVAVLRQVKRPDVLVEIARRLPELRFVVCGEPTRHRSPAGYGERIISRLRAEPNIEYLGKVTPEKALQVIGDAAILLSTSDLEGFPSTFLEAWAAGTPVVSLKIDPDHVIERIGLGLVPGSVDRVAAELPALIESAERRGGIGARARAYVAEAHSDEAVTRVFERDLAVFS